MMTPRNRNTVMGLPFAIHAPLRYSTCPALGLTAHSTRADVRRVRARLPEVRQIGPVRLREIDAWLNEDDGGEKGGR